MSKPDPSRPLLFTAMPFGTKGEPGGTRQVDFDALYRDCVKPAAEAAGVEAIRADDESAGGIVHGAMFERLLLAEIVLADLTFANANVFYELGIRHAARPCSTILTYARTGGLPFDLAPVRAIQYELDDVGSIVDPTGLRETLEVRLRDCIGAEAVDSPLFQLVRGYPGIDLPHGAADSFRSHAVWLSQLTVRAKDAVRPGTDRLQALETLGEIERSVTNSGGEQLPLLVTILLAYRSVEAWGEMIRVVESMPPRLRETRVVREQLAMALNRRNESDDRRCAIAILRELIDEQGKSPETFGILGRCLKDRWTEKSQSGDAGAIDALSEAIDAYRQGFEADPREHYPGINLLTLLLRRGLQGDIEEVRRITPVVSFAVARKGGIGSGDCWTAATVLELAVIEGEERLAQRALSAMLDTQPDRWMRETTAESLDMLCGILEATGQDTSWVAGISDGLRAAMATGSAGSRGTSRHEEEAVCFRLGESSQATKKPGGDVDS